uniref:Aminopeptidase n=1 Tax=Culex tarsalis TaxID=7177 RepID=A0A1Q3FI27_CULTA
MLLLPECLLGCLFLANQIQAIAPLQDPRTPKLIEQWSSIDETYKLRPVSEPLSYELFLDLSDPDFYTYSGHVNIRMKYLEAASNSFYLNSAGLVIENVRVTKPNGEDLPVANVIPMEQYQQMYFGFAERLEQNAIYNVYLEFSNNIGTDLMGLYRSSYTVGNVTRYIATTHFESTYARMVFPCYDEPSYKALFDIQIRHRAQYHALSNMPIVEKLPEEDGQHIVTRFDRSPLMSTFLVAFIVSDYVTLSDDQERIKVYAPENQVKHTIYALDFAQKSLEYLESYIGHPFQLPKVDLVAIPDFNMDAMENWGLITFRSMYLIYDPQYTTARTKQNIADLITHEFVHSWFGNEVTPEWWTYLWLSEGFARYFEYYVTSQIESSWQLWDQFVVTNVHAALSQDDKASNRPMSYYATEPDVLNGLFDYVVYAKSASVIKMIQNVIGFETLQWALRDYIASRSYQTTKPDYLYESIQKYNQAPLPGTIAQIFNSWADNAGYPVVTVTRNGNTVTYSQKRFWTPVEGVVAPPDSKFFIPLNHITAADPVTAFEDTTATDWLTPSTPQITKDLLSSVEWILVNKLQTGYYRVNYDEQNWAALTNVLKTRLTSIPAVNRAQLIDDSCNLAKAGEISYKIPLTLLQYLEQETAYIPWSTAYNSLIHLNRMLSVSSDYSRFEHFVRTLAERVYASVLLTGSEQDHVTRLHRGNSVYLACYFGVERCLQDAQKLAQKMLTDQTYTVPEEVQSSVFCAINRYETTFQEELLKVLFDRYLPIEDDDPGMITRFITGMGCTRNVTTIKTYLALTVTNLPGFKLTGYERNQILTAVLSGSYEGLRESLRFMLEYYGDVSYLFHSLASIFTEFGNRINSKESFDLLKTIVDKYRNVFSDSVKAAADRAIVQAGQNVAWVEKHSAAIENWLEENGYELTTTPAPPGDDGGAASVGAGVVLTAVMMLLNLVVQM